MLPYSLSSRCTAFAFRLLKVQKHRVATFGYVSRSSAAWNLCLSRSRSAEPRELEPMYEVSPEGGEGVRRGRWRRDDWKTKQRRFTQHITNLVRKGKVEEAEQVYQDMLAADVRPSTAVFNNLIAGLSRSGHAQSAFKYFNDLKKRRLVPTNHTYTSLFKSFSESGHTSRPLLEKVVAEIDRRDVLLNTIATNSLMVAMTTCGMGAEEVFGVYGDMTKRGVAPDVSTFTTLLTTCSLDRERGMGMVEGVWREMMASGISPDLVCYHSLLRCLREAGASGEMGESCEGVIIIPPLDSRELLSAVDKTSDNQTEVATTTGKTQGNNSSTEVEDSLVVSDGDCDGDNGDGCENGEGVRRGRLEESEPHRVVSQSQLKLRILGNHSPPVTVHITKSGLRILESGDVARLLSEMKKVGVVPDKRTVGLLSKMAIDWVGVVREVGRACGDVGGVNKGRGVVKLLDEKSLLCAIQVQVRLGNRKGAEVLRSFGEDVGLFAAGSAARYTSQAPSCSCQSEGLALLTQMKEDEVTPDTHTLGILMRDAAARFDYEYLIALMKEMRHSVVEPDLFIWRLLKKVANGRVPQSQRMKLRYNGFKGYYTIWKKHYPHLESRDEHVPDSRDL